MKLLHPLACVIPWLVSLIGLLALLFAPLADPATYPPNEIEIQASLSGYNLLWPSQRCCAYKLHIFPNGRETVVANVSTGEKPSEFNQELTLTSGQFERIRQVLKDTDFLNAPSSICCWGVDSDERHLSVRIGTVTHTVTIPDGLAPDAPLALMEQFTHLRTLWAVVTEQANIPGATVH